MIYDNDAGLAFGSIHKSWDHVSFGVQKKTHLCKVRDLMGKSERLRQNFLVPKLVDCIFSVPCPDQQ